LLASGELRRAVREAVLAFYREQEDGGDACWDAWMSRREEANKARIAKAIAAMEAAELDGLLLFQQESMYYLTGYDSFGFCFFQCLYLGSDGSK
jgi:hypothetical protein